MLPDSSPVLSINTQSDVYVVKFNSDGNYMMSGHADRSVKVKVLVWRVEADERNQGHFDQDLWGGSKQGDLWPSHVIEWLNHLKASKTTIDLRHVEETKLSMSGMWWRAASSERLQPIRARSIPLL